MNLKIIASALVVAAMAAPSAFASTGTVTFNGGITNTTCLVDGLNPSDGAVNKTVNLPVVSSNLLNEANKTAGRTGFNFRIGGDGDANCTNGTKVYAHFEPGATVNPQTGDLKVDRAGANVEIQLFDGNDDHIDIYGPQGNYYEIVANNQARLAYSAGYIATAVATVGKVSSSVVYTISFEPAS